MRSSLIRYIFAVIPILLINTLQLNVYYVVLVSAILIVGTFLSKERGWIVGLQGLTLLLIYALAAFSYLRKGGIADRQTSLLLFSLGYFFSGLEGFFSYKKISVLFAVIFWGFIALGLSFVSYEKMGYGGIVLAVGLITLIMFQDIKKLMVRIDKRKSDNIQE
ncbi:MAG: hypothetical protein U9O65_10730 [Thermotogota bacterium]|nr:hypothetical protein [Thermotogota bacterium]